MVKRNTLLAAAIAVAMVTGQVLAADTRSVDVPAGDLTSALEILAKQSGVEFVYEVEELKGIQTKGAHGELTAESAVAKLLEGTRLVVTVHESGAVLIAPAKATSRVEEEGTPGKRARLAQGEEAESRKDEGSREAVKLEEIVVTAQKREERLQDVPISISVLSGEQLDSYTGGTARDILRTVPGVTFSNGILGDGTVLSIRGVSPSGGNVATAFGASTVGYYMDGVPFGFVQSALVPDTGVYDLDRIEVLRGPQGTLYGASSLNGVVRVLTHEPDLDRFQLKARTSGSTTKDGDETYRVDGAINVPIIEDKLAARATVSYADVGGWIDSFVKEDINSSENLDARLKLKAQPTDALSIGLSYWRSRHDQDSQSLSNDNDFYPGGLNPRGNIDFDTYGGEIAYEFPGFIVSSTTSYMEYSNVTELDWTAFSLSNLFEGALTDIFETTLEAKVFSEELLVRSSNESDWRWSLGAFYRDATDKFSQKCRATCVVGLPESFIFGDSRAKSESYAVFGELTKLFMGGALELTGGLRYFHDRVENSDGIVLTYRPSADFEKVTPRAILTWHANEDATLYASYSEGFRSGFNQNATVLALAPEFEPVEPDTLRNYEIGTKGNLWDNRLAYEVAIYYLNWDDVQQSLGVPLSPGSLLITLAGVNVSSASGPGAEFSLTLRPVAGLNLAGSFGINDITVDSPILTFGDVLYEKGSRLNGSGKYSASGSASYTFRLGASGLDSMLSLSGSYTSAFPQRFLRDDVPVSVTGDPFFSMDARVGIGAGEKWSLQLFVENMTNERGTLQIDNDAIWDFYNRFMRPRTMGLQFEIKY